MNLILCGFKSCGKSYFGKLFAERHKLPFIDTDQLLEKRFSLSCAELTRKFGEKTFRFFECEIIASLENTTGSIIALGGGSLLASENAKQIVQIGTLIYLQLEKETLKKRLLKDPLPTFLDPSEPERSFNKMFEEREPLYQQLSHIQLPIEACSDEEVLSKLEAGWAAIHSV